MTPSQRYVFAHRTLPQIVHDDPEKAQKLLSGPEGPGFLAFLWHRVGERLPEDQRSPAEGLATSRHVSPDGTVIVLVTMPPPRRAPEAFFAAAVFTPGPRKMLFFRHPPTVRYVTLELGHEAGGAIRTVLCGWSKDGDHYNMGDGPPPESEAFLARVQGIGSEAS
jgi:hypothetical protein